MKTFEIKISFLSLFLLISLCFFTERAYAGTIPANHYAESGDWSDPTNVEALAGDNSFAATQAFNDWSQTQAVSTGAGISGVINTIQYETGGYEIKVGNFQSAHTGGISVTSGSYIAFAFSGVGADVSLANVSANVMSYHLSYTETNGTNNTGYVIVYFKLNAFTVTYGTTSSMALADLVAGTNASLTDAVVVTHNDLMGEPDPGAGNVYVSSGLLDGTPEIPPQAIPAVYTGLGAGMWALRRRFSRKPPKKKST